MPLGRSAAHKICVSGLELAKTLISKEALKSFQLGEGLLIRWQFVFPKSSGVCFRGHCCLRYARARIWDEHARCTYLFFKYGKD